MLVALKIAAGVATCVVCSAAPWAALGLKSKVVAVALGVFVVIAALGTVFGIPLYPYSDAVVLGLSISGGVLLGRALPTRFMPVLIVLVALSVLDVAQVALFNGPPSTAPSTPSTAPDPHFIWLNFRLPLPSGHFNIGFADLVLVTALAENFRRTPTGWPVAAVPGVFAIVFGGLIAETPAAQQSFAGVFSVALIPYLTVGWLVALALARGSRPKPSAAPEPRRGACWRFRGSR